MAPTVLLGLVLAEEDHIDSRKLFCGNIDFSSTVEDVSEFFSQFGPVQDVCALLYICCSRLSCVNKLYSQQER